MATDCTTETETPASLEIRLRESGELIRHYSNSRTLVLAFLIPICLTALGTAVADVVDNRLFGYIMLIEIILYLCLLLTSLRFSAFLKHMRNKAKRLEKGEDVYVYEERLDNIFFNNFNVDLYDVLLISVGIFVNAMAVLWKYYVPA